MNAALFGRSQPPAPVLARPPLPPFPPGTYDQILPWDPPYTRDYLRANAWGITLPGAPFVPGGSSKHPERILSWFWDRYPQDWQARWLWANRSYGYTHAIVSAPDSLGPVDNGPDSPPGGGFTLDQFVGTCRRIKATLPYVTCFLGSKYFQPRDMTVGRWIAYVAPLLDALLPVVDEVVPGWEWDLWNVPGATTVGVAKYIGNRAHTAGKSCWLHFSSEKTSWFADGDPRGRDGFWADVQPEVDGILYQTTPTWDIPTTQARLVDTLSHFGDGPLKLRFFEDQASLMFDGDLPDETAADLRGYCACCTVDNVRHTGAKVWGYGNGARRPDGTRL